MDVQQYNVTEAAVDASNPSGAWAGAPALAASTVAMTNTSDKKVVVYISSGTVTVVKVNGITTGLTTAATVLLRRGDQLAITYSVAPTLKWIYA